MGFRTFEIVKKLLVSLLLLPSHIAFAQTFACEGFREAGTTTLIRIPNIVIVGNPFAGIYIKGAAESDWSVHTVSDRQPTYITFTDGWGFHAKYDACGEVEKCGETVKLLNWGRQNGEVWVEEFTSKKCCREINGKPVVHKKNTRVAVTQCLQLSVLKNAKE